jgi:ATP-dependent RNA helicase DeaD
MTRYFINQGKKDGFSPKLLMGMINSHMDGLSPEIGQIEIMKMFSFFEMESGHTSDLQRAAKQMEFNGREVAIEESSPRPEGSDRKEKRSRRRDRGSDNRGNSGRSRRRPSGGSHGAKRRRRY